MTEKPILFSAPMIIAILEGRKTQTRRVVAWPYKPTVPKWGKAWIDPGGTDIFGPGPYLKVPCDDPREHSDDGVIRRVFSPYGEANDRLWVRETWAPRGVNPVARPSGKFGAAVIEYRADGQRATYDHDPLQREHEGFWRPSIFMPRWASRITLEVTDVRVQRGKEISEEDAMAE